MEAESLIVELTATGSTKLTYTFQIFPDGHGISVQLTAESSEVNNARTGSDAPRTVASSATGIESDKTVPARDPKVIQDALESLDLAPQHVKLTQVRLLDQTDIHNELVFEDEWMLHTNERLMLKGNLFHLQDPLTGDGLIFLKEAPLPHARPVKTEADFTYEPAAQIGRAHV